MCTGAEFVMGLQGLGALNSAKGAYYGAASNKVALEGQADIDQINARMSEGAAQSTLLTGQREEQKSRLSTAQLKSTQRANMAANGVDLGVGSAEQVLTTTDTMGEIDANTIQGNAIRSAWGYRVDATNSENKARSARTAASAIDPEQAAFTSMLGSATQVASGWYQISGNRGGAAPATADPRAGVRGQRGY